MTERAIQEFPYRYEMVPVERLFVDKVYQRKLPAKVVRKMVEDWRPHLVGTLAVSERRGHAGRVQEGAIIDGQTRWNAAMQLGIERIPSCVYVGLDQQDEAAMFADIQTRRRGVTSDVRFNAAVVAGDPEALQIKALVEGAGYRIGHKGDTPNTLGCVAALEVCFRRDPEFLELALLVYHAAWKERELPTAWHVRGLWRYLRDHPKVDTEKLSRRLMIAGADSTYTRALDARKVGGLGSQSEPYMAAAINGIYTSSETKLQRGR